MKAVFYIALVIALLSGIGSFVVTEMMVKDRIEKTEAAKKTAEEGKAQAEAAKAKADSQLKTTKAELDTRTKELAQEKDNVKSASEAAAAAEKKAGDAETAAAKAKEAEAFAKSQNKEFWDFGKTMSDVKKTYADLASTKTELSVALAEKKILHTEYNKVKDELETLRNPEKYGPDLTGVLAKVKVVDPKWDFVVLDAGGNQGVRKNGEMAISRDGQLIGRIKIVTVESNHAIANVMQAWKKKDFEIQEGDTVVGEAAISEVSVK
ncbi:MAG: hypothetical protein HY300_01750 [Verrucomicrobia bacterium]|nr:hypothetical protein [Verrucomicrobiota bacterium]